MIKNAEAHAEEAHQPARARRRPQRGRERSPTRPRSRSRSTATSSTRPSPRRSRAGSWSSAACSSRATSNEIRAKRDALQEAWTEAASAIYAQASASGATSDSGSSASDDEVIEDADYEVVDERRGGQDLLSEHQHERRPFAPPVADESRRSREAVRRSSVGPGTEKSEGALEREALAEAIRERDEYLDALQRLKAEFDNYRKRVAREQEQLVARAAERLVKQLLPMVDDLERAVEAAVEHGEMKVADGVRLVHRSLGDLLAREGLVEVETDGHVRSAHAGGAALAAVRRARGHGDPGAAEGLQARRPRPAPGAGRVSSGPPRRAGRRRGVLPDDGRVVLRDSRRPQERVRRRAEEGVPQARPRSTTRTRTRATPTRSGSSRRCRGPTTCSRTPRSASSTTRSARPTAGRGRRTSTSATSTWATSSAGSSAAAAGAGGQQAQRGQRGSDVEVEVRISFEDSLKGLQTTVPVTLELACHTCHGTGAAPGTAPKRCPNCEGTRRRRDVAGAVRPAAAVPGLPRQRHDRRHAVPDLPRLRPRAADEALHGADPGRRQGRDEDQAEGQGRGRLGRSSRRRPVRRDARRAVEALRAARRRPRARRAGHVLARPRWARPSRSRRPRAACRSRCLPARRTGSCCASRAAARRS